MARNKDLLWLSHISVYGFSFSKNECTHAFISVKVWDVKLPLTHTPSLLTSASHPPFKKPQRDLRGWEDLRKQTQKISYTQRSPLHLPAPISPHFCLLSFLSYELSFFLPFLLSPLISYCASFVECTQAKDLDEVSLFCLLKGTPLSFFLFVLRIWGREEKAFMAEW